MDKKVKKIWIEALRSGEYEQGQGALCQETPDGVVKHCCLGVLLDVADDQDWFVPDREAAVADSRPGTCTLFWRKSWDKQPHPTCNAEERGMRSQLSDKVRQEFDITDEQHEKLMGMNDSGKWSFRRIAGYIQRYM